MVIEFLIDEDGSAFPCVKCDVCHKTILEAEGAR